VSVLVTRRIPVYSERLIFNSGYVLLLVVRVSWFELASKVIRPFEHPSTFLIEMLGEVVIRNVQTVALTLYFVTQVNQTGLVPYNISAVIITCLSIALALTRFLLLTLEYFKVRECK
jgi:hypothetical protein